VEAEVALRDAIKVADVIPVMNFRRVSFTVESFTSMHHLNGNEFRNPTSLALTSSFAEASHQTLPCCREKQQ